MCEICCVNKTVEPDKVFERIVVDYSRLLYLFFFLLYLFFWSSVFPKIIELKGKHHEDNT